MRGIRPAQLRATVAGIATIDLLSFYGFIGEARDRAPGGGAAIDWLAAALSGAPVRALVIAIGIAGAVSFVRAPGRLGGGVLLLLALTLLSSVHARLFGSPWRHLFYSGLCLSGWLLGLMASRARGRPSDESYAITGSVALLGAAYLNAGISKLAFGGLEWASGTAVQAVAVAQDGLVRDDVLSAYRAWVVMSPVVARAFSLATVVVEMAGPLMILGGATRVVVAVGLMSMHLNIYALTGILYWESMAFLAVLGMLPHAETVQARGAILPVLASRRIFIGSAATLTVAALLAILHQHHRHDASAAARANRDVRPVQLAEPERVALPSGSPRADRIGPFSLGARVTDEWSIEGLSPTDGGFRVTLRGPAGPAAFEVDCADVQHRSPFDVGSAHIFYPQDVPFVVVQPVGNALRDLVRRAVGRREPCQAVGDWVASLR